MSMTKYCSAYVLAALLIGQPLAAWSQGTAAPEGGLMPVPSTTGPSTTGTANSGPTSTGSSSVPSDFSGLPPTNDPPSITGGTNQPLNNQPLSSPNRGSNQQRRPASLGAEAGEAGELPNGAGQIYKRYDLRPYTGYLTKHEQPHQAVVDWVLRDTGTDMWFTEPFGFMNANRDSLTVYHTPEIHRVVEEAVNKFVAGSLDPQAIGLRVLTVGSPNWRTRAVSLMEHVNVGSPGVQAWLVSKENAALLLAQLRARSDAREIQALDLAIYNGQAESLASTRRRNYVRNVRPAPAGWPPYEPETGEVEEGYKLEISPLLNNDGTTLDCVIRANIDQVEKLVPVDLDLPLPNGQLHRARVEVPQVASWRLHERFRWPIDRVLVLSCGVVASPDRPRSAVPFVNLDMLTGQTAGRADALLFVEFKGRASANIPIGSRVVSPDISFNRGRY